MQNVKEINEKTLRYLIPIISDAEVKESLKKNKEKLTLKFNTCPILMKDIEHVVRNATNTWKNVYLLHKLSDFPIDVKDDDDEEEEEKDEEENVEEATHFDNIDDEEEQEQEATEEATQDDKETGLVKIVVIVIASLPHSPSKPVTTSSAKLAPIRLIVTTSDNSNIQPLFAPIQLSTSLTKVTSTSSTKL